jgi:uncharacterized protein YjiS (DUF1127 family)
MSRVSKLLVLVALAATVSVHDAVAEPRTVCTITVNSPNEKDTFRRWLPADDYRFVELVERGRPDWLASACRAGVRCDVLIISGHFDDGTQFYSDRLDARESLPVEELQRASCSNSCGGVFSQLKEVYLFGCNTLNAGALHSATAEIGRSLLRSGHSPDDVDRLTRLIDERHADSNRDRMRQIFKDVPVIYGFSSKAPLGATAGPLLERYFQSGAASEVASGRPSAKLLGLFGPTSMVATSGMTDSDPNADYRQQSCRFVDARESTADKLRFVHALLDGEMAEVRMFLEPIEKVVASLDAGVRSAPAVRAALADIARDAPARGRYLAFARDADEPATRARMIALAGELGWLSKAQQRAELVRMLDERLAGSAITPADIDLACTLNRNRELDALLPDLHVAPAQARKVPQAAILACLGSAAARSRVLHALTSPSDADVEMAQVYLHHRPIVDPAELRVIAAGITRMSGSDAQIRALDTLAKQQVNDRESLEALAGLFPQARSIGVQRAIAGILIRSDYRSIARPELVRLLRERRLKSPDGEDVIDVLVRRMQASS